MILMMNNRPIAAVVAVVIQVNLPTTLQQKKVTTKMGKRVIAGTMLLLQFLTNQSMAGALDVNTVHNSYTKLLLINDSRL
jgi:hypothetical protein